MPYNPTVDQVCGPTGTPILRHTHVLRIYLLEMLSSLPGQHRGFQPKEQRFIHASAVSEFKWKPRRLLWPEISGLFKSHQPELQTAAPAHLLTEVQEKDPRRYQSLHPTAIIQDGCMKYIEISPTSTSFIICRPRPRWPPVHLASINPAPCALPSVAFAVLPVSPRPSSLLHLELVQEWMTLKKDPA